MAVPVPVLYEDEWMLAADKPAGVLVHGDGTRAPTLTGMLREQLGLAPALAAELQPVQRLDVETSGVVLFSRRKAIQPKLDGLVAAHGADGVRKYYLAIVRGEFPWETREVDAPIARDRHDARRMRAVTGRGVAGGKPSLTHVRLLATAGTRGRRVSLLAVELATGRRHQIRVHLSSLGFPIVGDGLYGIPADRRGGTGLMLHAAEETFAHPVTGETVAIRSPYPERFRTLFAEEAANDGFGSPLS